MNVSTSTPVPQYMRCDDPATVAVCIANEEGRRRWVDQCHEFATRYGVQIDRRYGEPTPPGFTYGAFQGAYHLSGICNSQKPKVGDWKKIKNDPYRWAPFVKNPVHKEMSALTFRNESVPGLPRMVTASTPGEGFGVLWMFPTPFVVDGVAWVGMSHPGTTSEVLGEQWAEVLGSQFVAADEARRAVVS